MFSQFYELSTLHIIGKYFATFDDIDPPVKMKITSHKSRADRRNGPQTLKLDQDILFDSGG